MKLSFLPPQPFVSVLLRRGALLWLGVRALMTLVALLGSLHAEPPPLRELLLLPPLAVVPVTLGVEWLDLRRRNEDLLLANLGVGPARLLPLLLLPPLLLEAAVTALVRW